MRRGALAAFLAATGLAGVLALVVWLFLLEPEVQGRGPAPGAAAPGSAAPGGGGPVSPLFGPSARPAAPTPPPLVLRGKVLAADTGEPLPGAAVAALGGDAARPGGGGSSAEGEGSGSRTRADARGLFTLTVSGLPSALRITAPDFAPRRVAVAEGDVTAVMLAPNIVEGTVRDGATGRPVGGVVVRAGPRTTRTQPDGAFRLRELPPETVVRVEAPPYEPATLEARRAPQRVALRPREVRGVYLTFFGVGDQRLRANALRLLERSEVNAVVVDVKGDRGLIAYPTAVSLAKQIGAVRSQSMPDPAAFLEAVHSRGGLAIARIVVFKDDPLARARPELAVRDARTGQLWEDGEGLAWTDPFSAEVWEYNIALAVEVARLGFDEVQFDYIRFPTDASVETSVDRAVFSQPNEEPRRVAAIVELLRRTRAALQPYPARLSVDVFGYTAWRDDDMGIGQQIEALAPHVDVLAPMVYPSTFAHGLPLAMPFRPAPRHPYDIVHLSVKRAVERMSGTGVEVRPWLQYFDDYTAAGVVYGPPQLEAQKQAARDGGGRGWMFWDPTNLYVKGGFAPRG